MNNRNTRKAKKHRYGPSNKQYYKQNEGHIVYSTKAIIHKHLHYPLFAHAGYVLTIPLCVTEEQARQDRCRVLVFPDFPRLRSRGEQCSLKILHSGPHRDSKHKISFSSSEIYAINQEVDLLLPY